MEDSESSENDEIKHSPRARMARKTRGARSSSRLSERKKLQKDKTAQQEGEGSKSKAAAYSSTSEAESSATVGFDLSSEAESSSTRADNSFFTSGVDTDNIEDVDTPQPCNLSINEQHVCLDTDCFSDSSASELVEQQPVPERIKIVKKIVKTAKKRKPKAVGYQRKGQAKKKKQRSVSEEKEIDVEGLSDFPDDYLLASDLNDPASDTHVGTPTQDQPSTAQKSGLGQDRPESKSAHTTESHFGTRIGTRAGNGDGKDKPQAPSLKKSAQQPTVTEDVLKQLAENLKLLLPVGYTIDIIEGRILRLVFLNDSKNAKVEHCIYWENYNVGVFVHHYPVPEGHKIFHCIEPEIHNLGSTADRLKKLVDNVSQFQVCSGITEHQELWKVYKGYVDICSSQESPCYRAADCLLLVTDEKKVCQFCQEELARLKRRKKQDELEKERVSRKKKEHRATKRKADHLERKVDSLLLKLDEVYKSDFNEILHKYQHLMTPLQKIFWQSQLQAITAPDKRGLRWHPMMIRIALHLENLSSSAKEYLQETGVLLLPSKRRLYDYSHFIEAKEGCQPEILQEMKMKMDKFGPEEHHKYVNLMFDEMHLRAGLVTVKSTGALIGYTNLLTVEEELQKLDTELSLKTYKPRLAKKVLVYLAQGITNDIQEVVAVFSTDDLSAPQLYERTWDVIYYLEDAQIKVLSLSFDGAAVNRKFIKMHESRDKDINFIYSTTNVASGEDRPLFFIVDPPHLLKTVRNCLANSFHHRKTRKLWKNGQYISWQVIVLIYSLTKEDIHRSHKLTQAHVKLTSFSCMKVLLACQVFSDSLANCIEVNVDQLGPNIDTSELVKFLRLMNKFFDCLNGRHSSYAKDFPNTDHAPYHSIEDERFAFLKNDFLGFFKEWKNDVAARPGIFKESDRNRMIISHQSLEALEITVHGVIGAISFMLNDVKAPFVYSGIFNQDPLEQYFSKVRQRQGDNRHPTLKSFLDTRLNIHAQGLAALPPASGNTQAHKRELEVDSSTLPVKKKGRKP